MPVKARPVSATRAAAFARGQICAVDNSDANKVNINLPDRKERELKTHKSACKYIAESTSHEKNGNYSNHKNVTDEPNNYNSINSDSDSSSESILSTSESPIQLFAKQPCKSSNTDIKDKKLLQCETLRYELENTKEMQLRTFLTEQVNQLEQSNSVRSNVLSNDNMETFICNNNDKQATILTKEQQENNDDVSDEHILTTCKETYATAEVSHEQESEHHIKTKVRELYEEEAEESYETEQSMLIKRDVNTEENKSLVVTEFDRLMSLFAIDVKREREMQKEVIVSGNCSNEDDNTCVHKSNNENSEIDKATNIPEKKTCMIFYNNNSSGGNSHTNNCLHCYEEDRKLNDLVIYQTEYQANITNMLQNECEAITPETTDNKETNEHNTRSLTAAEYHKNDKAFHWTNHSIMECNNNHEYCTSPTLTTSCIEVDKVHTSHCEHAINSVNLHEACSTEQRRWWWQSCITHLPRNVANEAQERLDRFLSSIRVVEQIVHDVEFVRFVANYLHTNKDAFTHHIEHYKKLENNVNIFNNVSSKNESNYNENADGHNNISETTTTTKNTTNNNNNNNQKKYQLERQEEHSHDEYNIFNTFSEVVSNILMTILTQQVTNFDESEFVEELFDISSNYSCEDKYIKAKFTQSEHMAQTTLHSERVISKMNEADNNSYNISNNDANVNDDNDDVTTCYEMSFCAKDVLSYPAWRIIMSMSDFNNFFDWVMDYLIEYSSFDSREDDRHVIVGGGQGIRALLNSTYTKRKKSQNTSKPIDLTKTPTERKELLEIDLQKENTNMSKKSLCDKSANTEQTIMQSNLPTSQCTNNDDSLHNEVKCNSNMNRNTDIITTPAAPPLHDTKDHEIANIITHGKQCTNGRHLVQDNDKMNVLTRNSLPQTSMTEHTEIKSLLQLPVAINAHANANLINNEVSININNNNSNNKNKRSWQENSTTSTIGDIISNITSSATTAKTLITKSSRLRQLMHDKQQQQEEQQQLIENETETEAKQIRHSLLKPHRRHRCLPPLREEATRESSLLLSSESSSLQFSATAPVRSNSNNKYSEVKCKSNKGKLLEQATNTNHCNTFKMTTMTTASATARTNTINKRTGGVSRNVPTTSKSSKRTNN